MIHTSDTIFIGIQNNDAPGRYAAEKRCIMKFLIPEGVLIFHIHRRRSALIKDKWSCHWQGCSNGLRILGVRNSFLMVSELMYCTLLSPVQAFAVSRSVSS